MKNVTRDSKDLIIRFYVEPEDMPIRGNASVSGDDEFDKKVEDELIDRLDNGDPYAWFCAHVQVTYRGTLTADDYLGGCSFNDAHDFQNSGYANDMIDACIFEINNQINKLNEE